MSGETGADLGQVTGMVSKEVIAGGIDVRVVRLEEIDDRTMREWLELEQRALEPNAYLSPRLVVPAVRHLGFGGSVLLLCLERAERTGPRLVGVGAFQSLARSRHFPLPHLRAFRSPHSYLSGLLVGAEEAGSALRAFFRFLRGPDCPWHGVAFYDRSGGDELDRGLTAAAVDAGAAWFEIARTRRAVFVPAEAGERYVERVLGRDGAKNFRRRRRRLEEIGPVEWRSTASDDAEAARRFIDLEHLGWRGERGRSLKVRPGHAAFFEEMTRAFGAAGQGFFTELRVRERAIASTINLIAQDVGFAFKLGWDPAYARYSPGLLNELELLRNAPQRWPHLRYFDSGADEGSFIDRLWSGRRTLVSGIYATSSLGKQAARCLGAARRVKRWLRGGPVPR
ncbi:cellulose biosynthesis protein CelD [Sulfurifustis variabilis]|uniref:Cellulose biosynthesis protein CelD n=2 Tax=Sulfurifustis variabilis TaxID=1675686 RepID=A0A1B4V2Z6_9GAMM|nr:cellulose biosynthesis protein CelD [Sulfurifustis variabilis]